MYRGPAIVAWEPRVLGRGWRLGESFVIVDDAALAYHVAVEIDGDNDARAERPADRDRYGIDEGAVHQPAAVDLDRAEDAGKREGGSERVYQAALVEPHLVAGAEL